MKNSFNKLLVIVLITVFSVMSCSSAKQEKVEEEHVRAPAVAGQFYPGDSKALQDAVQGYLESASKQEVEGKLVSLIVPHAGYAYSGKTAAHAYTLLKGKKYDTIVLIGSSHQVAVDGAAIYNRGYWKTPLGKVEINSKVANDIISKHELFKTQESAFMKEHSLEVQVPFLQTLIKDFQLVPILVNQPSKQFCDLLAEAIVEAIKDKNALIVSSTDMSHVSNDYEKVKRMDKLVCDDISNFDIDSLSKHINTGKGQLCGSAATLTTLLASKKLGADTTKLLNYTNSYEITGNKSWIVGYCAYAVSAKNDLPVEGENMLNDKQKATLLKIARETLEEYIRHGKTPAFDIKDPVLKEERGGFVTLHKKGQLRGCIGYIMPIEAAYKTVSKMAIQASTEDPRFPRVTIDELKDIDIEISILTVPKLEKDPGKIEMGRHGVIVKSGLRQGVFLPQVATETGWTREEFLSHLCSSKAGLAADAWKDSKTELYTFEAQVFGEEK